MSSLIAFHLHPEEQSLACAHPAGQVSYRLANFGEFSLFSLHSHYRHAPIVMLIPALGLNRSKPPKSRYNTNFFLLLIHVGLFSHRKLPSPQSEVISATTGKKLDTFSLLELLDENTDRTPSLQRPEARDSIKPGWTSGQNTMPMFIC